MSVIASKMYTWWPRQCYADDVRLCAHRARREHWSFVHGSSIPPPFDIRAEIVVTGKGKAAQHNSHTRKDTASSIRIYT